MHVTPEFVAAAVVAAIVMLDRYTTLLDRFKKKSASDAAAELAISEQTISRLRDERNKALRAAQKLEQTRSLEPILEQLHANAELQASVLDRLIHHNGSFKHIEESLAEIREGLRLMTGFIAGVVELPIKPPAGG
jgi:DNA-binding Xre family transcriptional regulator